MSKSKKYDYKESDSKNPPYMSTGEGSNNNDEEQLEQVKPDCANHKKDIAGITDMKKLAEMIGDLHYQSLSLLMYELGRKIAQDARKDLEAGRKNIGSVLLDASLSAHDTHAYIHSAWLISKPFMQ